MAMYHCTIKSVYYDTFLVEAPTMDDARKVIQGGERDALISTEYSHDMTNESGEYVIADIRLASKI